MMTTNAPKPAISTNPQNKGSSWKDFVLALPYIVACAPFVLFMLGIWANNQKWESYFEQGRKLYVEGRFDDAASYFEKAANSAPKNFSTTGLPHCQKISSSDLGVLVNGVIDATLLVDECKIFRAKQQRYFSLMRAQNFADAQKQKIELSATQPNCISPDDVSFDRMGLDGASYASLQGQNEQARDQYRLIIQRCAQRPDFEHKLILLQAYCRRATLNLFSSLESSKQDISKAGQLVAEMNKVECPEHLKYERHSSQAEYCIARIRYLDRALRLARNEDTKSQVLKELNEASKLAAMTEPSDALTSFRVSLWQQVALADEGDYKTAAENLAKLFNEAPSTEDRILWYRKMLMCRTQLKETETVDDLVKKFSRLQLTVTLTQPKDIAQGQRFFLEAAQYYVDAKLNEKALLLLEKVEHISLRDRKAELIRIIENATRLKQPDKDISAKAWLTNLPTCPPVANAADQASTAYIYVHNASSKPIKFIVNEQGGAGDTKELPAASGDVFDKLKLGQAASISVIDDKGNAISIEMPALTKQAYYFDWRGELVEQFP